MTGTIDGCGRPRIYPARQLLHLAGTPRAGATPDGSAIADRVARGVERHRAQPEPAARRDVSGLSDGILPVDLPERVGHRRHVSQPGDAGPAVPQTDPSRPDQLPQP